MNKKGFTLIEIIVAIILMISISIVSIIGGNVLNNNKEGNLLEKNSSNFKNALEIYLTENPNIINNINDNVKTAVVSLEILKNEGLIKDNLDINYKNNYFTLSNAILLNEDTTEEKANEECKNQIELKTFASWEIDKNSSEIIYICPKESDSNYDDITNGIDELLKRIEALEKQNGNQKNIYKGELVNNYVYFNVDSKRENSSKAFWPETNKNLWRIYSYYGEDGSNNNIKLVYSQPVEINNDYITVEYETLSDTFYKYNATTGEYIYINRTSAKRLTNCSYNGRMVYNLDGKYYIWQDNYGKASKKRRVVEEYTESVSEYIPNTFTCTKNTLNTYNYNEFTTIADESGLYNQNSMKGHLLNNIKYKDWIDLYPYYTNYVTISDEDAKVNYGSVKYEKIGVLTLDEFRDSVDTTKTWLNYYKTNVIGRVSYQFDEYVIFPSIASLDAKQETDELSFDLIPVITLKSGVKIIKDNSCSNPGSISCPYKLSYNGIETSN